MKHKHRFVAVPVTGQSMSDGKEAMFGWRVECEVCCKKPEVGNTIEEIKASWCKEVVPESCLVSIKVS